MYLAGNARRNRRLSPASDRHPRPGRKNRRGLWLGSSFFREFLGDLGGSLDQIDEHALFLYMVHLRRKGLKNTSLARNLSSLRGFFDFLVQERILPSSPAALMDSPKLARKLPEVLSRDEVTALLARPAMTVPLGFRDRTMLELLYACGLRVSELVSLAVPDFDPQAGLLRVLGKGSKERYVPLHESAVSFLLSFLRQWRPCSPPRPTRSFSTARAWACRGRASGSCCAAMRWRRASTAGLAAHPAPLFRHAPAGRRGRSAHRADPAWAQRHHGHGNLYPCAIRAHGRPAPQIPSPVLT
jgi:site-specific recombinase XerC